MGVTSSCHPAYYRVDKTIDKLPCHVAWGVAVYPAYVLKDGDNGHNHHGGNLDEDVIVDDFSFDLKTAPTLFLHGDSDPYASMGSVKVWEKMRAMGVQSELHTYATRVHGFHKSGAPGTGSYTWMERLEEFLAPFLKD
jgi:pimeloyl-ACP methyl ester carboxylesterase